MVPALLNCPYCWPTAHQNDTGGPWASVLKGLFGIEEVEVFG